MTESSQPDGTRLRLARQARGLSQQQLAGVAGVTRQAVSAVESGHSDPSLRVALGLARALGMTVEELFGPGDLGDPVLARPVAAVSGPGSRVALATVGDTFVALRLAAAGLVHAAGVHRTGPGDGVPDTEDTPLPGAADIPGGADVVGFASWREGLVVRPGARVRGLGDVASQGLRLVNREPGAQARTLLDRERMRLGLDPAELSGYDSRAAGHLQVAAAIVGGLADAGVSSEPAALAYGLDFIPLAQERFDLVLPAKHAASREVQGLLRVLTSPWLLAQLASLPGYDAARCGERAS